MMMEPPASSGLNTLEQTVCVCVLVHTDINQNNVYTLPGKETPAVIQHQIFSNIVTVTFDLKTYTMRSQ